MDRIEKIRSQIPDKMFFDPSFEFRDRNKLLVDVVLKDGRSLLTRDQEYQIFRKYNYFRYRLLKLTVGFKKTDENPSPKPCSPSFNLDRLSEKAIVELENLIGRMLATRNVILQANTRLVFRPVGRYAPTESADRDELVSNAYVHVIKAIECFDYRRGIKFSSYCVNVLKTNLWRDVKKLRKIQAPLEFSAALSSVARQDETSMIREDTEYRTEMIAKVFKKIGISLKNPEEKIEILKNYYGLSGSTMLLREIGDRMNLSKERVRQIKLEAMNAARHLNYDP